MHTATCCESWRRLKVGKKLSSKPLVLAAGGLTGVMIAGQFSGVAWGGRAHSHACKPRRAVGSAVGSAVPLQPPNQHAPLRRLSRARRGRLWPAVFRGCCCCFRSGPASGLHGSVYSALQVCMVFCNCDMI